MWNTMRIGQSGVQASTVAFENAAQNIACQNVPGYAVCETRFSEQSNGGVSARTVQIPPSTASAGQSTIDDLMPVFNDVSLETEMVNMIVARHSFSAALSTIKAADEMVGMLLDVTSED